MNYFAHGRGFVDDPYFLAGVSAPDWMNVADRRVRVRSKHALAAVNDADPVVARVAAGMLQHFHDDAWFHGTRAFGELSLQIGALVRDTLPADDGFRPSFLGHILVEILLDAALIAESPDQIERYYAVCDQLDGELVERAVNRMASRPTDRLAALVPMFSRERFLLDYADDAKLLFRLNQVMRRVQLATLPPTTQDIFSEARRLVIGRQQELLTPLEHSTTSESQRCTSA